MKLPRPSLTPDFALLWRMTGGLPFETEYRFEPPRCWRFDLAWPSLKVAVELEGGKWSSGRHTRPIGFQNDCVKYNRAVELGWRVLRYTADDLRKRSDDVLEQVTNVLNGRSMI